MFAVIINIDRPDSTALRLSVRAAHRDYLHGAHDGITLKLAGPMLAPDGKTMIGSLIVIEAATLEAAEAFADADPYHQAGLFSDMSVRQWNWVTGNPANS